MSSKKKPEQTVSVYKDVRDLLERLHALDARLASSPLQAEPAFLHAKKLVMSAQKELSELAELLEGIHTRPKDGTRGTTRDIS